MLTTPKVLVALLACILIIGSATLYMRSQGSREALEKAQHDAVTEKAETAIVPKEGVDSFTTEGTIVDLLKRGTPISCAYVHTKDGVTGSGTVYLDGTQRFSLTNAQVREGKPFDSHMIYTSTDMYLWVTGDTKTFALKMPVKNPITSISAQNDATLNQTVVYEDATYTCTPWRIDEQVFTPPTDISFMDIRSLPGVQN